MKTVKEIENEYANLCGALGDCIVKMNDMERVKAELITKIEELQKEWMAASSAAASANLVELK